MSPEEADDAAQDAVERAWRRRETCRDPAVRRSWVATIARREALRRAVSKREVLSDMPATATDVDAAEAIALAPVRIDVARALEGLEDEDRLVLELRYRADLTQRAIATELGMPEGTVKVRLHRLRKQLRDSF